MTAPQTFRLSFEAVAGSQPLSCETKLSGLGLKKANATLLDFAFFIHGIKFLKADGSTVAASLDTSDWQAQNVALLDFQDKSDNCLGEAKPTNHIVTGSIPMQDAFEAIQFTLGIPPELNHVDPASVSAPLNAASMFWSWQSGYKAMRLDLSPEGGVSRPDDPNFLGTNYFFHLGSTGCSGDALNGDRIVCDRVDQPTITLHGFHLQSSTIKIDIAALLSGLDINTDLTDTPGCMSSQFDAECASFFEKLGMDLDAGVNAPGLKQAIFTIK